MKDKIEKGKIVYPQNNNKIKSNKEDKNQDTLQNAVNDLDDAALGNQMDEDILTIDEDTMKHPNPTKQDGEENERPGGGLRK